MTQRVVVAMSGGVDSAVAAAELVHAGYEVIGITMEIWPSESPQAVAAHNGCCGLGAVEDAKSVARVLDIPHYVLNLREEFQHQVMDYFVNEYRRGRTPNPCIACNRHIKFDTLLQRARRLGADLLATGHYARVERLSERYGLRAAEDLKKDQSYVLYNLTQQEMAHLIFPMGGYEKVQVRAKARQYGLPVADKADSMEICFVPDDYRALFGEDRHPGTFEDVEGRVLGQHAGIEHFTVGQRRGIGVSAPRPYYVTEVRAETQVVVLGSKEQLWRRQLWLDEVNWVSTCAQSEPFEALVRPRAHAELIPATVTPQADGGLSVRTHQPLRAPAPGQAAVLYSSDGLVLAGGIIQRTN